KNCRAPGSMKETSSFHPPFQPCDRLAPQEPQARNDALGRQVRSRADQIVYDAQCPLAIALCQRQLDVSGKTHPFCNRGQWTLTCRLTRLTKPVAERAERSVQ